MLIIINFVLVEEIIKCGKYAINLQEECRKLDKNLDMVIEELEKAEKKLNERTETK